MQNQKKRPLGGGNVGSTETFKDRSSEKPNLDDLFDRMETFERTEKQKKERSGGCGCGW